MIQHRSHMQKQLTTKALPKQIIYKKDLVRYYQDHSIQVINEKNQEDQVKNQEDIANHIENKLPNGGYYINITKTIACNLSMTETSKRYYQPRKKQVTRWENYELITKTVAYKLSMKNISEMLPTTYKTSYQTRGEGDSKTLLQNH